MKKQWWHNKVAYQIYPKSFLDSNGDGIGDIKGIINKLDYLKELGVDILWICPIYPSPMVDQGYDISDYYGIHPAFGTMSDFDELLVEAKKRDMYVLLDLVVNHCSDKHIWFQEAMKDPDGRYGKYFYILDGNNGNPPNNWRSDFGGSCWKKIPGYENKFYFHTFAKEQPDLNWENKELREEIYQMVNWWLEKGVSGFRVDAIMNIKKDLSWSSLPADSADGTVSVFETLKNADGIDVFLSELRDRCFIPHNALTVGEIFNMAPAQLEEFIGDNGYFSTIFEFSHSLTTSNGAGWYENVPFDFKIWRKVVFEKQALAGQVAFWANIIENHDQPRGASHFIPDEEYCYESVTALAAIVLMLKGIPFIYQGQEIGMRNCHFASLDGCQDISTLDQYRMAVRGGLTHEEAMEVCYQYSRDNARTPMQWTGEENAGFSANTPWLQVNPNYTQINVASDRAAEKSVFKFYQALIALRKHSKYSDVLVEGELKPIYTDEDHIFAYERILGNKSLVILSNYHKTPCVLAVTEPYGKVLLNNYPTLVRSAGSVELHPYQTIILEK